MLDKNGIENVGGIQGFLDSLYGATIYGFKVLQWETDPKFEISTDKGSFVLHSNDIGIFIDNINGDFKK